jgi:hypothetical protein
MVIPGIELERAPVIKGIVCLKVCELRGKRDGPLLLCLTVEDLYGMPMRRQGGCEIGEADRLRPHRCSIKIADGRLNEEDFHGVGNAPTIAHGTVKPIVERISLQIPLNPPFLKGGKGGFMIFPATHSSLHRRLDFKIDTMVYSKRQGACVLLLSAQWPLISPATMSKNTGVNKE